MRYLMNFSAALSVLLACARVAQPEAVTVTINSAVHFQTIRGWGAAAGLFWAPERLREDIIEESVNGLGLTRLRFEPARREWEDPFNDDGDPEHINWSAFKTRRTDAIAQKVLLPFKRLVEANGEHFSLYVSPSFFDGGSSGAVPAWLFHSPGEYAEYATAILLYLKEKHHLVADYYCICNEAGNNNPFSPEVLGKMIKVLGPKLKALGFHTKIQFPECVNANMSWDYIRDLQNEADIWLHIGLISYHLYGNNEARQNIRDFALSKGLPTGQTEFMGLTINHLYDDLTLGGVSYWEFYALNDYLRINPSHTWFSRTPEYWNIRQVTRYVRPGAVRIEAASNELALRSLAFVQHGEVTVVLLNNTPPLQARQATIRGLPAGSYAVSQSVNGVYQELGRRIVDRTGTMTVNMPANAILTVYPDSVRKGLPPVVTDWKATPSYLTAPASSTTLSAAAVDPELERVSYQWSVVSQPKGANVVLSRPRSATTLATGLSVAGDYIFAVTISDPLHKVTRRVKVAVFEDNQPPEIFDLHNRIPVTVTLPTNATTLRAAGWDLEGEPLKYRWSLISQPAGANVVLATPDKPSCLASNMTVAGDYIFKFEVSDPTHIVSKNLKVTVYPENQAPIIYSISATPANLTLPASSTFLSATTRDPDGDVITHWWSVKSAPAAAKPVFAKPGAPKTAVSGLISTGAYVFTLTVVDRTKVITKDITVTVAPPEDN